MNQGHLVGCILRVAPRCCIEKLIQHGATNGGASEWRRSNQSPIPAALQSGRTMLRIPPLLSLARTVRPQVVEGCNAFDIFIIHMLYSVPEIEQWNLPTCSPSVAGM